jgi:hypothetical protein
MDDNNHNNLFSARVSFFVAVLAFLSLLATSIYAIICPNRSEFIDIHTYIVIVPVRSLLENTYLEFFLVMNYFFFCQDCGLRAVEKRVRYFAHKILKYVRIFRSHIVRIIRFAFPHLASCGFEWRLGAYTSVSGPQWPSGNIHLRLYFTRGKFW